MISPFFLSALRVILPVCIVCCYECDPKFMVKDRPVFYGSLCDLFVSRYISSQLLLVDTSRRIGNDEIYILCYYKDISFVYYDLWLDKADYCSVFGISSGEYYMHLNKTMSMIDECLEDVDMGFYFPHYNCIVLSWYIMYNVAYSKSILCGDIYSKLFLASVRSWNYFVTKFPRSVWDSFMLGYDIRFGGMFGVHSIWFGFTVPYCYIPWLESITLSCGK